MVSGYHHSAVWGWTVDGLVLIDNLLHTAMDFTQISSSAALAVSILSICPRDSEYYFDFGMGCLFDEF
jgi:hypothetical protein